MPVETAKCWWLLKIEPNAWAGGKGSCAVCVDLQAVGALEFFGELYNLAKGFGPIFEGVWAGFRESEGSIFSNHQHFAVSTGKGLYTKEEGMQLVETAKCKWLL